MIRLIYITLFAYIFVGNLSTQKLAILKDDGGGDWYSNPTALKNLIQFCNAEIRTNMVEKPNVVAADDSEIF
ncbi:MAG: DUF4159 domain-containing protein, partial [Bacteroidota bacterium]|nr:DUF4159 domain-containing protein [Bacteroidota bacterium]